MEGGGACLLLSIIFFLFSPGGAAGLLRGKALPTDSGYLPVNTSSGSAIFFAFYEAQHPTSPLRQRPLVVWLQGGPGCSSMIGNFFELGPWRLISSHGNLSLRSNRGAWNRRFGLLFLDNPIGTGFSVAHRPDEIPRNQISVATHLFIALRTFLSLHPSSQSRPLYLTGESYAGKYVPAFAYHILKQNSILPPTFRINLQGTAIGNGLTDPASQITTHADTAYFSGLINAGQRAILQQLQAQTLHLIREEKWHEATDARNRVLDTLSNMTGLATLYDLRRRKPYEVGLVTAFLQNEDVKKALGVERDIVFELCSDRVGDALHEDVMKSVRFMVEGLLRNIKVMLYQGIFDLRDGVVSTEAWMEKMKWAGLEKFLMATKKVWEVDGKVYGYVQKWSNLTHVVVSGAGHFVPADQSLASQTMIEDWILENDLFSQVEGDSSSTSPKWM